MRADRHEYQRAYDKRPEVKEKIRAYSKIYRQRPEVKAKLKARAKDYEQRPEVKERKRIRERARWARLHPRKEIAAEQAIPYYHRPSVRARMRRQHLRREYGITQIVFDEIFAHQGGVCAICKTDDWGKRGPAVDHDHCPGGGVRGILCNRCNTAIGLLKDDAQRARAVADYLERKKKGN